MILRAAFPAMILALLLARSAPAPERSKTEAGQLWEQVSAPFRKGSLLGPLPGHRSVAGAVAGRRMLRSPFAPPVGEIPEALQGGPRSAKSLTPAEGRALLIQAAAELRQLEDALESGVGDKSLKSLDALNARLSASLFPNRDLRAEAQALSASVAALKHRVELRMSFLRQNPRVTFIIWSPDGRSLAVINRRVMHEGDPMGPGVTLAQITQHEVVFELEGERIAVGLK